MVMIDFYDLQLSVPVSVAAAGPVDAALEEDAVVAALEANQRLADLGRELLPRRRLAAHHLRKLVARLVEDQHRRQPQLHHAPLLGHCWGGGGVDHAQCHDLLLTLFAWLVVDVDGADADVAVGALEALKSWRKFAAALALAAGHLVARAGSARAENTVQQGRLGLQNLELLPQRMLRRRRDSAPLSVVTINSIEP